MTPTRMGAPSDDQPACLPEADVREPFCPSVGHTSRNTCRPGRRKSSMNTKWIETTLASLVICSGVVGSGYSTAASATMRETRPDSIPHGWRTYRYGRVRISVPSDWTAVHCPVLFLSAPGTLDLGKPTVPTQCPAGFEDGNTVTLSSLPPGDYYAALCPTIRVNGLLVHVGPCGSSNPGGMVFYVIPSLGVQAVGTGTNTENVTGPGTETVVGRVLHTLRR